MCDNEGTSILGWIGDAAVLIEGTCTTGGGFLRRVCGAEPIGSCVYCGAPFCDRHGDLYADYHQVCSRPVCQAKFADVQRHREWVGAHSGRNNMSICAADDCQVRLQHMCQRCGLKFCQEHLQAGDVIESRYDPPRKVTVVMCGHCASRRRIWD